MPKSVAPLTEREAAIRDYFAKHLDKIEEGLKLVQKEYAIRGLGTVDILCKNDLEGYFGIIELKRDLVTPGKLLDQLVRYTAALRLERSLDRDEVRCFLIGPDFDKRIRVVAGHLENVFLKKLVKKGKGYSLLDVPPETIPKLTLKEILSSWKDRIMLRGWAFGFNVKYDHDVFIERAKGWLDGRSCDALMIMFEPFEGMMLPHHVEILTVAPDQYIGVSKIDGLVALATKLMGPGHLVEPGLTDTGIIRFWFTKPAAPKIMKVIPFGSLSGLSGDEWKDYILKKTHLPYHSRVPRWFHD